VDQTKEAIRDIRMTWIDSMWQDVGYAVRTLRRAPAFTLTAIVTLALGIGATTAVFSLINGVLLRELPVKDPHRLATISSHLAIRQGRPAGDGWSYPMWEGLRDRAQAFDGAFVWMPQRLNLAKRGEIQLADGVITTSDFFSTLGVPALLGRTFTAGDDRRGGGRDGPVTVISHAFWQRHLAGAPNVIGMSQVIEGVPFTIVGVTPAGFVGVEVGRSFDVALTFGTEPMIRNGAAIDQPNAFGLIPMLRLKPGQTLEAATDAIRALQPEILGAARVPPSAQEPFVLVPAPTGTSATGPGMSGPRQRYERPLFIVLMIAGLLLIMACANIANLLLVRATSRRHELSVRLALGASRWRLVGQLLVESLMLGIAGALSALVLAQWATMAIVGQMSTPDASLLLDVSLDWRVLAFTAVVTTATVVLFGAAPAVRAAREARVDAMKADRRGGWRRSRAGTSDGLVIAQVALSLVLLVAAGLLARTLSRLAAAPLGFDRDEVLLVTVDTMRASVAPGMRLPLYERLVAAVSAVPGVERASASTDVPLSRGAGQLTVNAPRTSDPEVWTLFNFVSPRWFATYGTRSVMGRDFDDSDSSNATPVVVVNETFARSVFPGTDPIGQLVRSEAPNWRPRAIVGVVADAVSHSLSVRGQGADDPLRTPVPPTMYIPLAQAEGLMAPGSTRITIGIRPTAGSSSRLAASVGASIGSVDPNVSFAFRALGDFVSAAYAQERLVATLSGIFGALALVLAGIGLYGVSSYAASRRRTEIAVRMALGAGPRSIIGLMLRRVGILIGLGVIEGIVLSLWVSGLLSSLLYGLTADDPATLVGAILTLAAVGLAAGWLPAWRAARMEPIEVLREY
jgi:predicted permease